MKSDHQLGIRDIWIRHVWADKHYLPSMQKMKGPFNGGSKGIKGKGWEGSHGMNEGVGMAVRLMGRTG